jgi:DNA-3-methyladenine glycosylase II
MRPPRFAEFFEAFANVIPFQQVSLEAGVAIVGRMVQRFGTSVERGGRPFHGFPSSQAIAESRLTALRACGLSARKAESLRLIARALERGELTEAGLCAMSTEDALRTLAELPGVGPWSAGVILLRGLGRLDVFPPGDVGAQRGIAGLMGVRREDSLDRVVRRFGDLRGYLYFCALGASLLRKGLIQATGRAGSSR